MSNYLKYFSSIEGISDLVKKNDFHFVKNLVLENFPKISWDYLTEGDIVFSFTENAFFKIENILNKDGVIHTRSLTLLLPDKNFSPANYWTIFSNFSYYICHRPVNMKIVPVRLDYCQSCNNDNLYWHAMTAKCSICHKVILGG